MNGAAELARGRGRLASLRAAACPAFASALCVARRAAAAALMPMAVLAGQVSPVAQAPAQTRAQVPAAEPVPPARAGAGPSRTVADSVVEARTTALAATLRCPVCQGLSIQDSPSELAQQMRALIRDQVAAGKSDAEIRDYFLSKYGEFILLEPRPRGFNLLAYLLPAAVLVAGGWLVARNVRRWSAPTGVPPDLQPPGGEPTGAEPTGAEPTGAEPTGAEPTGAEPIGS